MATIPKHILEAAAAACDNLLPSKSKDRYTKAYAQLCEWKLKNNVKGMQEDIMMAFFFEKSKSAKSSTLWSTYSMIKSMIKLNENIDIGEYKKLTSFLKRTNDTYSPKKSHIFTAENVQFFLNNAPDESYLLLKVALIFGLSGACRVGELCYLMTDAIGDTGEIAVVTLADTKTKKKRVFTITNELKGYDLFIKYSKLRPKNVPHGRFFLFYKFGKCTTQPVGITTFGRMPQRIAQFLNLPDSEKYTGHCFRRTSASFLADSGVEMQVIKRHGGWRSSSTAEGYLEDSVNNKIQISKNIFKCTITSTANNSSLAKNIENIEPGFINMEIDSNNSSVMTNSNNKKSGSINISGNSNCTIYFYNNDKQ